MARKWSDPDEALAWTDVYSAALSGSLCRPKSSYMSVREFAAECDELAAAVADLAVARLKAMTVEYQQDEDSPAGKEEN
jgi:hypothetical protein